MIDLVSKQAEAGSKRDRRLMVGLLVDDVDADLGTQGAPSEEDMGEAPFVDVERYTQSQTSVVELTPPPIP